MRNGHQKSIPDLALDKAMLLGAEKPVRVRVHYKCTQCNVTLKSSHVIPESKAPEGLTGMVVPCICLKCAEKQIERPSTDE